MRIVLHGGMRRAFLVAVIALAGCGGEARAPEDVARQYVASDDPAKCDDADLAFLEEQTGEDGAAARDACRRNVERTSPPRDVRYVSQSARGELRTVRLEADGQDVRVELRPEGDDWLVVGLN